jgi:hypothetical protein
MLSISMRRIGEAPHDQGTSHVLAMRNRHLGEKPCKSQTVLVQVRQWTCTPIRFPGALLSLLMEVRRV